MTRLVEHINGKHSWKRRLEGSHHHHSRMYAGRVQPRGEWGNSVLGLAIILREKPVSGVANIAVVAYIRPTEVASRKGDDGHFNEFSGVLPACGTRSKEAGPLTAFPWQETTRRWSTEQCRAHVFSQ